MNSSWVTKLKLFISAEIRGVCKTTLSSPELDIAEIAELCLHAKILSLTTTWGSNLFLRFNFQRYLNEFCFMRINTYVDGQLILQLNRKVRKVKHIFFCINGSFTPAERPNSWNCAFEIFVFWKLDCQSSKVLKSYDIKRIRAWNKKVIGNKLMSFTSSISYLVSYFVRAIISLKKLINF